MKSNISIDYITTWSLSFLAIDSHCFLERKGLAQACGDLHEGVQSQGKGKGPPQTRRQCKRRRQLTTISDCFASYLSILYSIEQRSGRLCHPWLTWKPLTKPPVPSLVRSEEPLQDSLRDRIWTTTAPYATKATFIDSFAFVVEIFSKHVLLI